jgi:2-oxoglutarate dehydrogenase E1 component
VTPVYNTGVEEEKLKKIGNTINSPPSGFHVHSVLGKIIKGRLKSINDGENIDWSTAESLAFGTLLAEGNHVRLSGQVNVCVCLYCLNARRFSSIC